MGLCCHCRFSLFINILGFRSNVVYVNYPCSSLYLAVAYSYENTTSSVGGLEWPRIEFINEGIPYPRRPPTLP
nr:MAG TPA: hypothetical protein [Caudoviricetes sp.]